MVQAALIRVQNAAGVLTAVVVAFADGLGAQLWALLRHLGIVYRYDNGGHTDRAANAECRKEGISADILHSQFCIRIWCVCYSP